MKCKICKRPMILDGDIFICHYCEIGINTNYIDENECGHKNIKHGVDNWVRCLDCGGVFKLAQDNTKRLLPSKSY